MARRERWDIIGSILVAVDDHRTEAGRFARVTNVALLANVPYDRLLGYLEALRVAGLVTGDRMPALTSRGREFLRHYRAWTDMLARIDVPEPKAVRRSPMGVPEIPAPAHE